MCHDSAIVKNHVTMDIKAIDITGLMIALTFAWRKVRNANATAATREEDVRSISNRVVNRLIARIRFTSF